jgi:hypothetical protein
MSNARICAKCAIAQMLRGPCLWASDCTAAHVCPKSAHVRPHSDAYRASTTCLCPQRTTITCNKMHTQEDAASATMTIVCDERCASCYVEPGLRNARTARLQECAVLRTVLRTHPLTIFAFGSVSCEVKPDLELGARLRDKAVQMSLAGMRRAARSAACGWCDPAGRAACMKHTTCSI